MSVGSFPTRQAAFTYGVPLAVLLVALLVAGSLYSHFLTVHRYLWTSGEHDRNAHYLFMLNLAADLRDGRLLDYVVDADSARMWPPLQGMLGSIILAVGGMHYQLAVLPALFGWVLTIFFGFLVARRAVGPEGGNLAGVITAFFLLLSPAPRAFATDVMLESLGAGLSMMALYWYLATVQGAGRSPWPARWLGLTLSLLLLQKYNYWLLVVAAITIDTVFTQARARWSHWWELARAWNLRNMRRWLRAEARQPLTYPFLFFSILTGVVMLRGPVPLRWGNRSLSLHPPFILLNIAYAFLLLRLIMAWRHGGREAVHKLDPWFQPLVRWHLIPLSIYLVFPKRLGCLLLSTSPANGSTTTHFDPVHGVLQYLEWFRSDYCVSPTSCLLALGLCAVGIMGWQMLQPGGRVTILLIALSLTLASLHPNQKARFLHSWIPGFWVIVGCGVAVLGRCVSALPIPRLRHLRPMLAAVFLLGLLMWHRADLTAVFTAPGHALEGGPNPAQTSLLELSDYYLPDIREPESVTILAGVPYRFMAEWTFLEANGNLKRLERNWFGFRKYGPDNVQGFHNWLEKNTTQTIVCLEQYPGSYNWGPDDLSQLHQDIVSVLHSQTHFHEIKSRDFPNLSCRVSVWKRSPPSTASPPIKTDLNSP